MTRSAHGSIATIDQFINTVDSVKTASDGTAPLSEPGSIGGETKHPVKKVDDRLEKAKEGERSSENSKDVKDAVGAPSIENAPEASTKAASIFDLANKFAAGTKKAEGAVSTPGSAEEDVNQTGTKKAPTGEDSASETNSAKAGKEDPGSKHPARTDNTALDGHKYAADDSLEKLASDMREIGNQVLTAVHGAYQNNGIQAPASASHAATKQASAPAGGIDPRLAAQAGFELAGLVNGTWDKKAADAFVQGKTVEIIKQASDRADLFIHYANNFLKAAEGEGEETPDPSAGAGGGGEPPAPGGEGGGAGGGEGDMMAALGGGEGADAGGGMGGAGGMGGGAGGGEDPEAIELAHILASLGVTPEQLEQAMAQQAAGGAGGAGGDPMGGGGAPPPPGGGGDPMAAMGGGGAPPPPPGGGMETQASAGARKQPMTTEKHAAVKAYITEVISRSRTRR